MAVATKLRTQINVLRHQHDTLPGEAPKSPDAWYAIFRRTNSSRKKTKNLLAKAPDDEFIVSANSRLRTLHAETGSVERNSNQIQDQSTPGDDALVSSPFSKQDHPRITPEEYRQDAVALAEPPSAVSEVRYPILEPSPVIEHPKDAENPPIQPFGLVIDADPSEHIVVPSVQDKLHPEALTAQTSPIPKLRWSPSSDGMSSQTMVEPTVPQNFDSSLKALSEATEPDEPKQDQSPVTGKLQSEKQNFNLQKDSQKNANPPENIVKSAKECLPAYERYSAKDKSEARLSDSQGKVKAKPSSSRQSQLAVDEVPQEKLSEAQKLEIQLFDTRVGPWMQSIIRHNIKGLGYGQRVRIDLGPSKNRVPSVQSPRTVDIIITCCGLSSKQIREIENLFSKPSRISGLQGFTWIIKESTGLGFRGGFGVFSNTAVWGVKTEPLVDIALLQDSSTLSGSPIQVTINFDMFDARSASWTCGGLILVNNRPVCLTTAHPLVMLRRNELRHGESESNEEMELDPLERLPWQTAGSVKQFALSSLGSVPDNCDWLLFDVKKQHHLPNRVFMPPDQEPKLKPYVRLPSSRGRLSAGHTGYQVYTSHGIVTATLSAESAFLQMGDSAFKTMKLVQLSQDIRFGDSGAWVIHRNELVGIIIAGDDDSPASAFAVRIEDVMDNISNGMGDVTVELPSEIDNKIMEQLAAGDGKDNRELISLYMTKALQLEDNIQPSPKLMSWAIQQVSRQEIAAYIAIGKLFEPFMMRHHDLFGQAGFMDKYSLIKTDRLIWRLADIGYGYIFLQLVAWLVSCHIEEPNVGQPIEYVTLLIQQLIDRMDVDATCAPRTNTIRSIVGRVARGRANMIRFKSKQPVLLSEDPQYGVPTPRMGAVLLYKLMTFDRTRYIYVYKGPFARWLSPFIGEDDYINPPGSVGKKSKNNRRVFLEQSGGKAFAEMDGKVVQYPELENFNVKSVLE